MLCQPRAGDVFALEWCSSKFSGNSINIFMGKMELAGTPLLPSSFARLLAGPLEKIPVMHELRRPKFLPLGHSAVAWATP